MTAAVLRLNLSSCVGNVTVAFKYPGILCSLLASNKLPYENIQANVIEMLAGGVDTVSGGGHMSGLPTPTCVVRSPDIEGGRAQVGSAFSAWTSF